MPRFKKFDSIAEAVYAACDSIGDLSATDDLVEESTRYYNGHKIISKPSAIYYRLAWRKMNNVKNDCRTNSSQFRRNMYDDDRFSSKGWTLLTTVINDVGLNTLALMLKEFHSIDQLHNMVDDLRKIGKKIGKKAA